MKLKLEVSNDQQDFEITEALVEKLEQLLELAGKLEDVNAGEVALTFVNDEAIHALNKEYRGIDRPTDVLSFSMLEAGPDELEILYGEDEDDEDDDLDDEDPDEQDNPDPDGDDDDDDFPEPLGDIIISVPMAIAQSEEYGHSIEREIGFLFVHGFLHLLGYDHQDEAAERQMFAKQEKVLQEAGITR